MAKVLARLIVTLLFLAGVLFLLAFIAALGYDLVSPPIMAEANPNKCPPGAKDCICACHKGDCMWMPNLPEKWEEGSSCSVEEPVVIVSTMTSVAVVKEVTATPWIIYITPTPDPPVGGSTSTPMVETGPTATPGPKGVVSSASITATATDPVCDLCREQKRQADALERIADLFDQIFAWLKR